MSKIKSSPWTIEKTRIWQCAIKSTGMPPSQEALDALIEHHCEVMTLAKMAYQNLDDDIECKAMRHSCGEILARLRHALGSMLDE